jgi:chaperonin GroES
VLVKAWLTPATAARPDRDNTSFPFFKTPGGELIVTATKVNIKPLEDRILVQALEAETTTASGIVIPDTAKEKPQEGTVLAVGPGRVDDKGTRIPVDVSEGDIVLYSKYGGSDVKVDGKELKIVQESEILAIVG